MYSVITTLLVAAVGVEALKAHQQALNAATRDLTSTRSSGKLLDNFSQSDMDFEHWVDQMVAEGHLFRPKTTELSVFSGRDENGGWLVTVKNVACSTVTGSGDLLERAEGHFCDGFIKNAGDAMAREMELDVMRLICDNGTFCKLGVKSVFDFFRLFPTADDISGVCHDMFNAIQDACPAGGGVADTEVTFNGQAELGQLEFSYSLSNGDGCVPDATHECFDKDVQ